VLVAEQGSKKGKLQGAVFLPNLSWSSTARSFLAQPWFASQCKRLQFRAGWGMMHQKFCWSLSGISLLEHVWFGAACVLQVMEEVDFSP